MDELSSFNPLNLLNPLNPLNLLNPLDPLNGARSIPCMI